MTQSPIEGKIRAQLPFIRLIQNFNSPAISKLADQAEQGAGTVGH